MFEFALQYSWLIPLLPLLGAAIVGFAGAQRLRGNSHWPIWLTVGGSAVLSLMILFGMLRADDNEQVRLPDVPQQVVRQMPSPREGAGPEARQSTPPQAGAADPQEHPEAASAHHAAPDGHVKAWLTYWYTWFEAGAAERGEVTGNGLYRRPVPARAPEEGQPASETPSLGGRVQVMAGALIDPLSAVMLCVVCGIGFLITVFAAGYMKGEEGYWRFFAYLGLFIFSMTVLVMGDNLILLYLGWEGVGLCSYLLIGYYYERPTAREAAKKAFIVNRVGDFGFAIGIMLIFYCFGTVSYFGGALGGVEPGFLEAFATWQDYVPTDRHHLVPLIPFALMLGAFGKSAQFPLHVWLPDAMEGPTPVSALIHAATMVTAGVYMIARLSAVFFQFHAALVTIALVGAFTALMAATIAMRQFDLKKVFAYSTISQLGYMFVAVAVLAPVAGVFHLVTHAFFKALLFLGSGVVMHAMLGHLDMRRMSGLKHVLPRTRWLMLIGCAALAGFPGTAGFFSKDEIIHFARHAPGGVWLGWVLYLTLLLTAFLTAYYTFRLYFRVFEGPRLLPETPTPEHHSPAHQVDPGAEHSHAGAAATHATAHGRTEQDHHDHEPAIMIVPLVILALGALVAGLVNFPGHWLGKFLAHSPSFQLGYAAATSAYGEQLHGEHAESLLAGFGFGGEVAWGGLALGAAISIAGIALAGFLHWRDRAAADRLAHSLRPAVRIADAKWFFDEFYGALVVGPLRGFGKVLYFIDDWLVDGAVRALGAIPVAGGFTLRLLTQTGRLQGYAVLMLLGIGLILLLLVML